MTQELSELAQDSFAGNVPAEESDRIHRYMFQPWRFSKNLENDKLQGFLHYYIVVNGNVV